jgi:hypothetical protein
MNFQLSPELKSTMDELVYDWIRLHYTEVYQDLEEMKFNNEDDEEYDEEYDEDNDAFINEYIKSQLFYQHDKLSFGKYLKESGRINTEDMIQLIQYCGDYYCKYCNTVRGIIDFTKIHDLEYLGVQVGYIYADIEINVLKEFNSIKNAPILK